MSIIRLFALISLLSIYQSVHCQTPCETITKASIQVLPDLLKKNDFEKIQKVCNTMQSSCPNSELALRLEILIQIIQKENTDNSINNYLDQQYESILITRYDDAAHKDYEKIYTNNPEKYQFLPLNSAIDSLIQVKAKALLNSHQYTLTRNETAMMYLFADYIANFYNEINAY